MQKLLKLVSFLFLNFGPLIIFYGANAIWGLRIAIISAIVWVFADITFHFIRRRPLSLFFKFTAAITVVFGLVDLYLQKTLLFKYEPSLSNAMVGGLFASSLFGEKPIIREFAEAQGRISKDLNPDSEYYFKFLTVVWSVYMFVKAAFYFWVAEKYTLEDGLAIRAGIGNISFYALLAVSVFGSRQIKAMLAKARMLPSARST